MFELVSARRNKVLINLLPLIYLHQAYITVVNLDTVEVLSRYFRLQNVHKLLILGLSLPLNHISARFRLFSKLNQRVFAPVGHLLGSSEALERYLTVIGLLPDLERKEGQAVGE